MGAIAKNIQRLETKLDAALSSDLKQIAIEIAVIKTKATIYGAIGGTVLGALISAAISWAAQGG